jgi:hypothetical protein
MDTAQARSIYLPNLGGILQLSSIGQPPGPLSSSIDPPDTSEGFLAEAIRFITSFPAGHVMTYSRWRKITELISFARASVPRTLRS